MAGDWIKMRSDLFTHPKVVRITSALKADRLRTVGGLMSVWCLFDVHSVDGKLEGYNCATVDEMIGWQGFAEAMTAVGWLEETPEGLVLPEFETHNGQSAKRRAQDADRKRSGRASAADADKKRTREEKSREDSKTPPNPPAPVGAEGGESTRKKARATRCSLKTFVDQCQVADEKPISEYRPLLDYVETTGLPMEHVQLCWQVFKGDFLPGGDKSSRLQADWRKHFLNYVKKGYYRLWYAKPDGTFELSTAGIQAKTYYAKKAA
ncbi:hypothetical protein [Cupriavidus necator]|uniref:hypothetical protein n=1 Tax=Cupriavidus necator TaxID=106590 RepID=UPI001C104A86|nr:hypothetical protein [Cupriavidus necator]